MAGKIPKTGLAAQMRGWMVGRSYKFTVAHLCEALELKPGAPRERAYKAMQDFVQRGEVVPLGSDRRCRGAINLAPTWYAYNPSWHRVDNGVLNKRIYKAMRLISFREPFTVADIQRSTQSEDRNYIDKITRKLVKSGHLRLRLVRTLPQGGQERYYQVIDTDRFLLEVMR